MYCGLHQTHKTQLRVLDLAEILCRFYALHCNVMCEWRGMWIVVESVKADFTCQRCFLLRKYPAQDLGLGGGLLELPTTDSSQVQLVQVQVHRGQGVHRGM